MWSVLSDLDAYDEWNPVIRKPRSRLEPGGPIDFTLRLGKINAPIAARIVRADGRELRWKGPRNKLQTPLARGEHFFRIQSVDEGSVDVVHGEDFGGPLFALPWRLLEPRIQKAYAQVNQALKERAESRQG